MKDSDTHVVILGAGPGGLTAAYELTNHTISVLVLEKDPHYVGGISRTERYNGFHFDIGGHRFFSKSAEIEAIWTDILGKELITRPRLSRIFYRGKYFAYPLKPLNALKNLGIVETTRCIISYAIARLHPVKNPVNLEEWVSNQFGKRLFSIFFKTYTEKVWGMSTSEISADWASQRIKGLNLTQAIRSAFFKHKEGMIKTLIEEFRYPRLGPGQMWEQTRMLIEARGANVLLGHTLITVRHSDNRVTCVVARDAHDQLHEFTGTHFISTVSMRELVANCNPPLPDPIRKAAESLKYRDFLTVALFINQDEVFPDNWIYLHDANVKAGRIQNFKNWSPDMVPDQTKTCLGLEYFCFEGDGLWTASDDELVALASRELSVLGICESSNIFGGVVVRQPKAYPIYDDNYKRHIKTIRTYIEQYLPNLHLIGRNGMHHYNNQDHSMMTALLVARNIALGTRYDPWQVNTDAEYHEEVHKESNHIAQRLAPQRVLPLQYAQSRGKRHRRQKTSNI